MGIFSRTKKIEGMLGIDFGSSGLKLVELRKKGEKSTLSTYGYASYGKRLSRNELLENPIVGVELLKELIKKSGAEVKEAVVSLPSQEVFHSMITVPASLKDRAQIDAQARIQASKLLRAPIEEMVLDITILDADDAKQESNTMTADEVIEDVVEKETAKPSVRRVLISAAQKSRVEQYASIFATAGITLRAMETEAFALIRSLVGKDRSRVMVIDMGHSHTSVTIVQEGVPYLHRSIETGGFSVTERIASSMNISFEEAEQVKIDLAYGPKQEVPPVLLDAFKPILHEARFTLELYDQQDFHVYNRVDKIILTGGSAHLPFLDPYLSDALDVNVYLGNPWARIASPATLTPVLEEVGPRMSVAVGLAMK